MHTHPHPQTNGQSNGLVPMLRVYNNTARYVDQGGNKRPGAFAIYLEPWHADVFDFLDLRKNHGSEEKVCTYVCAFLLTKRLSSVDIVFIIKGFGLGLSLQHLLVIMCLLRIRLM
jgi:hypothetical protein